MLSLVTGGVGYIGSICVEQILEKDYDVVVDNLQEEHREDLLIVIGLR